MNNEELHLEIKKFIDLLRKNDLVDKFDISIGLLERIEDRTEEINIKSERRAFSNHS